jgi:hypothetical protein
VNDPYANAARDWEEESGRRQSDDQLAREMREAHTKRLEDDDLTAAQIAHRDDEHARKVLAVQCPTCNAPATFHCHQGGGRVDSHAEREARAREVSPAPLPAHTPPPPPYMIHPPAARIGCPICQAQPGAPCRSIETPNRTLDRYHPERAERYRKARDFQTAADDAAKETAPADAPPIPDATGPFPIRNACPKCGARPYEQCKGTRKPRERAHTERYWAQAGKPQTAKPTAELAAAKAINAAIGGLPTSATPAPPTNGLTVLEMTVQTLVAEYTATAVIDAAWKAAERLHPRPSTSR